MPIRMWKHECPAGGGTYLEGQQKRCEKCGQLSVYDGWHLTMHEAMAAHQAFYGMKPLGPHHKRVHRLLGPLQTLCHVCSGQGIVTDPATDTWSMCSVCGGTGSLWTVPQEEVEKVRQRILREFPDAGACRPKNFLSGGWLALDVAASTVIDLSEGESSPVERPREDRSPE